MFSCLNVFLLNLALGFDLNVVWVVMWCSFFFVSECLCLRLFCELMMICDFVVLIIMVVWCLADFGSGFSLGLIV